MNLVRRHWVGVLAFHVLAGCARATPEDLRAPDDPRPAPASGAEKPAAPDDASASEAEPEPAPIEDDAATEHVHFEEIDAREGPADGVVAQPQRDPMPSLLDPKKWGPR